MNTNTRENYYGKKKRRMFKIKKPITSDTYWKNLEYLYARPKKNK
jgi:hypothetical protein